MNKHFAIALIFVATCAGSASATGKNDVKTADLDDARCKKEVAQYVEVLQFVRQSAGDQLGDQVMKNYVGIEQLKQTAASSGPCAAAQLLREKRATR